MFEYLYIMNKRVGKESAHLCSFLKQLVLWALCGLLVNNDKMERNVTVEVKCNKLFFHRGT